MREADEGCVVSHDQRHKSDAVACADGIESLHEEEDVLAIPLYDLVEDHMGHDDACQAWCHRLTQGEVRTRVMSDRALYLQEEHAKRENAHRLQEGFQ